MKDGADRLIEKAAACRRLAGSIKDVSLSGRLNQLAEKYEREGKSLEASRRQEQQDVSTHYAAEPLIEPPRPEKARDRFRRGF
jgi:hypothetical protein